MMINCVNCGFKVPFDEIGLALMKEHLKVKHDVKGGKSRKSEKPHLLMNESQ